MKIKLSELRRLVHEVVRLHEMPHGHGVRAPKGPKPPRMKPIVPSGPVLRTKAHKLWMKYRRGGRPTQPERDVLTAAYHESVLPRDEDYNVSQWVEDGFPSLG